MTSDSKFLNEKEKEDFANEWNQITSKLKKYFKKEEESKWESIKEAINSKLQ